MLTRIIDSELFSFLYPVTLVLSVITGYYVAVKFYIRKNISWTSSGIESAVIGFFALLLSFTFASSGNSMKDRENLVHQLADATADLRRHSLFVSDTLKEQTKNYLTAYLGQMAKFNSEVKKDKKFFSEEMSEINGFFLTELTAYSKQNASHTQETNQLLPHFSKMNSLFYRILYSYSERTPLLIILLILIASWLSGVLIGFMNGFYAKRHYLVPILYIILVALSVQTIRDLDNPAKGNIKPDYNNFDQQKQFLQNSSR